MLETQARRTSKRKESPEEKGNNWWPHKRKHWTLNAHKRKSVTKHWNWVVETGFMTCWHGVHGDSTFYCTLHVCYLCIYYVCYYVFIYLVVFDVFFPSFPSLPFCIIIINIFTYIHVDYVFYVCICLSIYFLFIFLFLLAFLTEF